MDRVLLVGAEEVRSAGGTIARAADEIRMAGNTISSAVDNFTRMVERFEMATQQFTEGVDRLLAEVSCREELQRAKDDASRLRFPDNTGS